MIITILGWIMVVILVLLIGWVIFGLLDDFYHEKKQQFEWRAVEKFAKRYRHNSDWLDSEDRKPFADMYDYIFSSILEYGHINAERLREKVDSIIKEQLKK